MEDYYEYLDSNGVTTLYKLIKDDTVALIDSYSVTLNGITTTLDTHINDSDIHTPITDIENMIGTAIGNLNYATPDYVDTKISGLVNSAPETLDTLKELSDALGNDPNFATTIANQIGTKASKDSVYTKQETDTLLEGKANSVHNHVVSDITDFPTIPTKLSQLENDMGFGTGGGSGDTSISWTNITDKPSFSDIAISGSYNDLVDTPNIPTKTSDLTNDSGYISNVSWGDISNKPTSFNPTSHTQDASTITGLATVATSGKYSDLSGRPSIPSKVSQLTNDSGYITSVSWNDVTSKPVLSQVAISGSYSDLSGTPTIPTKTSQLINDSGFLTSSNGLITSVSWSDITNKPNFSTVATSGSYNDLSNKPTIPKVYNKTLTIQKNGTNVATFTSNSNTDVTADITVPTKVSELSNDSGFITGISWDKVTNKPTLATVATSGSYTDLSNTPTIPTKLSQLENDSGFINALTDVVDTKRNQTINGTKTFTVGPVVSNSATTNGYFIKLNTIARNDVPTQIYHATFRALDKNAKILGEYCIEKSNSGSTLAHINVRSEDAEGKQLFESLYLSMSNDGSAVRFYPSSNNKVDLGMPGYKWANAYINRVTCSSIVHSVNNGSIYLTGGTEYDKGATLVLHGEESSDAGSFIINSRDKTRSLYLVGKPDGTLQWAGQNIALDDNLVHRSGNETISGNKTFTNQMYMGSGGTSYGQISAKDNNSILRLFGGTSAGTGANLDLYGEGLNSGGFSLRARTSDKIIGLDGSIDGTLKWNGKNVALDENLVHRSGDELIHGAKIFTNTIYRKNTSTDLTVTPASTQFSRLVDLADKNDKTLGYIEHAQRPGGNDLTLYVTDKNSGVHGVRLNEYNTFFPMEDNVYSLGSVTNKWANIHSTNTTTNRVITYSVTHPTDDSYFFMSGGSEWNKGANLFLYGNSSTGGNAGAFELVARNATQTRSLTGYPDGLLKWTGYIESPEFHATNVNAFTAQHGSYTFLIRNDGSNTYFLMSDKDGVPGTWSTARPLTINNATGTCNISGNANSATYATTPATSDNSAKIATTAWVRSYVNSVVGSSAVSSSISAYYSNDAIVTAIGTDTSNTAVYPADFSNYIDISPKVGTIYTGSQLFSALTPTASGTIKKDYTSSGTPIYYTTAKATATFSGAFSASAKYLCTTANAVKFRVYVDLGTSSSMGAASIVDQSISKSIFIRVE